MSTGNKKYLDTILSIKNTVNNNIKYYVDHQIINPNFTMNEDTISIVMTTHNRIEQTLFTLNTINASSHQNIQIIIVDDSEKEFINLDNLKKYHFRIDYLIVRKYHRNWINPCVNYNIGFKYVKGSHIIVQNAEVSHVGDVIKYVKDNLNKGKYLVFDVIGMKSYQNNNLVYALGTDYNFSYANMEQVLKYPGISWYQHSEIRAEDLHFLTAIHKDDLEAMDGFDYDFALGVCYDDGELIFRIKNILQLQIINVKYDSNKLFGIHLHHDKATLNLSKKIYRSLHKLNGLLYQKKIAYYYNNKKWLSLT